MKKDGHSSLRAIILCVAVLSHGPDRSDAWTGTFLPHLGRQRPPTAFSRLQTHHCQGWAVGFGQSRRAVGRRQQKKTTAAASPRIDPTAEASADQHPPTSALSALIDKATFIVAESWKRNEAKGDEESGSSRSASGGTSWADGSWLDAGLEKELVSMMNRFAVLPLHICYSVSPSAPLCSPVLSLCLCLCLPVSVYVCVYVCAYVCVRVHLCVWL